MKKLKVTAAMTGAVVIASLSIGTREDPVPNPWQPVSWNTDIKEENGVKTADISLGWKNYPENGQWKPLNPHFIEVSGGWESSGVPFYFKAPSLANEEALFESNISFDIFSKKEITDAPFSMNITAMDADAVFGEMYDMDGDEVFDSILYRDAFPLWDADLIYAVANDREPVLQKLIQFHSAPSSSIDARFRLRVEGNIDTDGKKWDKRDRKSAKRISFSRQQNSRRGIGVRNSIIWDSSGKREYVDVDVRPIGQNTLLTKHISPDFFSGASLPVFADATITVYPDPSGGATTFDGRTARTGDTSWTTAHDSANAATANDSETVTLVAASFCTTPFYDLDRFEVLWDTSAIGAGSTITDAVASFYGQAAFDGESDSIRLVTSNPASNATVSASDFSQYGTVAQANDITAASWSTSGYNDFTMNATGIGNVSKTGVSKFGLRMVKDVNNSAPTNSGTCNQLNLYTADQGGTSQDPKLVVTYTAGGGGGAPTIFNFY